MRGRDRALRLLTALAALGLATGTLQCGSSGGTGPTDDEIGFIQIDPAAYLLVGIGSSHDFSVTVRSTDGDELPASSVSWRSTDPEVATVNPATGRAVAVSVGVTTIVAEGGEESDEALLEVYVDPNTGPFVPGNVYLGREGYVEYQPGELPLVVSAPHGGTMRPDEISDRTFGVTGRDTNTEELTRALADAVEVRTGKRPHIIISRLHRIKLDPNREIVEAAQGSPFAEQAWREFQGFIEIAEEDVADEFGRGLYFDMHGHGHEIARIELGYLLSSAELALPDNQLGAQEIIESSSIRTLGLENPADFVELIRGATGLGGLLEARGYPAVPSPASPDPDGNPYFTGGYNTRQHGSRDGGPIDGIQLEHHFPGLRDTQANRAAYAEALADAVEEYLLTHYGIDWTALGPGVSAGAGATVGAGR